MKYPLKASAWFFLSVCLFVLVQVALPGVLKAEEDYSFDIEEFEKKSFDWGGYVELKWDHIDFNQDGTFYRLNSSQNQDSTLDSLTGSLLIGGDYSKGIATFYGLFKASGRQDDNGWIDMAEIYEAYLSIKPSPLFTTGIGKKSYKWGKGYAWNPVGFINRSKDPNNPEEALEGYITAEMDLIKSFSGPLQNAAFTVVALPVYEDVNEDFGGQDNLNLAAKLYLLYKDTDIDFVFYTGDSRSIRYGFDFAKNLATNFEIHGELAYVPSQDKIILLEDGFAQRQDVSTLSGLIGLRYLSENDITSILEYYHNGAGYTEDELDRFFKLVDDGANQLITSGIEMLLDKASELSLRGYGRPYPGRNYLYGKFTQKEPFDILYFTPGLTAIVNLDDLSSSITPELVYTGFTNWELRLRFSYLSGSTSTEYDEKQNSNKLEFRIRYFF